jgi:phytoene dehydrogenase-like protein
LLAQAQKSVLVVEASSTIGGSTRSEELTLPGLIHDVCSAVHPTGVLSTVLPEASA